MKVLHICNNFINSEVHQKMVQASRKLGIHNVVFAPVVTLEGRVAPGQDEYAVGCVNKWDRFFFYHKQEKTYRALRETIQQMDFDLIHAHCMFTDGNVALRLKREENIPYIITVTNTDINHFFRLRIFLRERGIEILREAAGIVFVSEAYRVQLFNTYIPVEYHAELLKKTWIIPFGIDDFWLKNKNIEKTNQRKENEIHLLYAGSVCGNKNPMATVKAMRILKNRGWKVNLTIAGPIVNKRLQRRLLHEDSVSYVGNLPKEDLLKFHRKGDVFVMPSFRETFGLAYAEALSQGVPILYSRNQGFDTQLPEGTVGFHMDPKAPENIAFAIENIMLDYPAIVKRCLNTVERFSWDTISRQYINLYQSVLSFKRERSIGGRVC